MRAFNTWQEWFRSHWLRVALLATLGVVWAGLLNLALYWSLDVACCWPDGKLMTFGGQFLVCALGGAPAVVLVCFLFTAAMAFAKRRLRCSPILACLVLLSTPVAFFGGRMLAKYLWTLNRGGMPWEELLPVGIGFLVACIVGLIENARIDYLRQSRGETLGDLPSSGVALSILGVVLLVFAFWLFFDAGFPHLLNVAVTPPQAGVARIFDSFGPRLAVACFLAVLSATCVAALLVRLFIGREADRTILRMMLITALVSLCLSLPFSYDALNEYAFRFRVRRELPRFEAVALRLHRQWPARNGRLPEAGNFFLSQTRNMILLSEVPLDRYPLHETFGNGIWRLQDGSLRFSLLHQANWVVEYHPRGQAHVGPDQAKRKFLVPSERADSMQFEVVESVPLREHWYLVKYSENIKGSGVFDLDKSEGER